MALPNEETQLTKPDEIL